MVEAGRRAAAPGALALVQAFVNTSDVETGQEELGSPARLVAWLARRGLLQPGTPAGPPQLERALAVREALRALLLANNGEPLDAAALDALDQAAAHAQLGVRFEPGGQARLAPAAAGVEGALGRILAGAFTAMLDGSWPRLKACRASTCHWAFYDASKNRSGHWCSMAVCGNRTKARSYRRRRAAAVERPP